jgi:transketolase
VLLGDGEIAEGQVWEAANFAAYHRLDNLVAILDANRFAQSGETMFGHHTDQYVNQFTAFGFHTIAIDGHNLAEIDQALQQAANNNTGKPVAIIAKTLKGKGVSFIEDKPGWHGKALKKEELKKALEELGTVNDGLRFDLKKPPATALPQKPKAGATVDLSFDRNKEYATREVFGEALVKLGNSNNNVYALDADVKNSTFTEDYLKAHPERFVECFIAEQNMVSVAAGLSRLGKIPFVATFAAFLTRAADQVRMARVSEANIKFVGSHVGVSIGEDGPSQMGLEDIALFGALPGSAVLQPADAVTTAKLVPQMADYRGIAYMRTLRPKTAVLYDDAQEFFIGGSHVLRQSEDDILTIAATGITVFEALKAADELQQQGMGVRVLDCYSIKPIDKDALIKSLHETKQPIIITVEDHFVHGGMGDFADEALEEMNIRVHKMAVTDISESGAMDELLKKAGIDATNIIGKVKQLAGAYAGTPVSMHA